MTLTDLKTIANNFNNFYINIGPSLAGKINTPNLPKIKLPDQNITHSIFLYPTDDGEVSSIIRLLKPKTSSGHDGISSKLIKQTYVPILQPLVKIINLSLETGIVPAKMKRAKVIPIFKSGDKEQIKNYRPVSLLPVFSKVLEKVVYSRLYKFITQRALLTLCQYGFREDLSTEMAILELQDRIASSVGSKQCCAGIFLDLSKAFDTLDHQILLMKLHSYGIRGIALDWFRDYLSDRSQYVEINGTPSTLQHITCGVPQGSILGPLLFLLYINDLPVISKIGSNILFADDTNILYTAQNYHILQQKINADLKDLSIWFRVNKLSVNETKTKCVVFYSKHNKPPDNWQIILNNNFLETVDRIKFLGVILHENLSWQPHLQNVCNKISKTTAILAKTKHLLPNETLRTIYNSLFLPHITYAIVAWGNAPASHMDRIIKLQKKAIRHITKSKYNSHTEPLFKSRYMLKISDLFNVNCCKIYYKCKIGKLHPYHTSHLTSVADSQTIVTRQADNIHVNRISIDIQKQTINYKIANAWNALPPDIKSKNISEKGFGHALKMFHLQNYQIDCNLAHCYVCGRRR